MNELLELVENLKSKVPCPDSIEPLLRAVWFNGMSSGASFVRYHVRHHLSKPISVKNQFERCPFSAESDREVWLSGFNAPIEHVKKEIGRIFG